MNESVTVETVVHADPEMVWDRWTVPEHIEKWNQASDDWHCPRAENDVRVGGRFVATMAAKDGSATFDFSGVYTAVNPMKRLEYRIDGDGHRRVTVSFVPEAGGVRVVERFDLEGINPKEMQRAGWQAILESFRRYVEGVV